MQLGDVFDNGESEASATPLAAARFIDTIKALENMREIPGGDARPGILHPELNGAFQMGSANPYLTAGRGVFQGVIDQIVKHLFEPQSIRREDRSSGGDVDGQGDLVLFAA